MIAETTLDDVLEKELYPSSDGKPVAESQDYLDALAIRISAPILV